MNKASLAIIFSERITLLKILLPLQNIMRKQVQHILQSKGELNKDKSIDRTLEE